MIKKVKIVWSASLLLLLFLGACDELADMLGGEDEVVPTVPGDSTATEEVQVPIEFELEIPNEIQKQIAKVYAVTHTLGSLIMDNVAVEKGETGKYDYTPTVYWPKEGEAVSFFSYIPSTDLTVSRLGINQGVLSGMITRNAGEHVVAPFYYAYALSIADTAEPVILSYENALCKVRVKYSIVGTENIQIVNASLNNYLTQASLVAFSENGSIFSEISGLYTTTPVILNMDGEYSTKECYMFPQNLAENSVYLEIVYTVNGEEKTQVCSLAENNDYWQLGEMYEYSVEIREESISINVSVQDFDDSPGISVKDPTDEKNII